MALQSFINSASGTGTRASLGESDNAFVASGVSLVSTDNTTIKSTGSSQRVEVLGSLIGSIRAIEMGDNFQVDSNHQLYVGKSGYISNYSSNISVYLGGAGSSIENEGTIKGEQTAVALGGYIDTMTSVLDNTGTIKGGSYAVIHYGSDDLVINNSGTIRGDVGDAGTSNDVFTNTGDWFGQVLLGGGNDLFDTRKGVHIGVVQAGEGDDTLYGNASSNTFAGGFDNDRLFGYGGNDTLVGNSGNDYLSGSDGSDLLTGGNGKDELRGGAGADRFIYEIASDSTVASAGRDLIVDFSQSQKDRIDLSAIDANSATAANNSFVFIGKSDYSDAARELRYKHEGGFTKIYGDTNGDGVSDIAIWIEGTVTLKATDFIL